MAEGEEKRKDKRKRKGYSSSPDVPDEPRSSKKNPTLGDDGASSPNSRSSRRRKRARDSDDHKSKTRKHKSRHKSSHSSHGKDKKSGDKHKAHKHGAHPLQELSGDDYYSKNNEFATWLKEEKSLFFSDLSSESARVLFSEFVSRWNANKLDPRYYVGIATGPRTSHKWNIKK